MTTSTFDQSLYSRFQQALALFVASTQGSKYAYTANLDALNDTIDLTTDAPASVTDALVAQFPPGAVSVTFSPTQIDWLVGE